MPLRLVGVSIVIGRIATDLHPAGKAPSALHSTHQGVTLCVVSPLQRFTHAIEAVKWCVAAFVMPYAAMNGVPPTQRIPPLAQLSTPHTLGNASKLTLSCRLSARQDQRTPFSQALCCNASGCNQNASAASSGPTWAHADVPAAAGRKFSFSIESNES